MTALDLEAKGRNLFFFFTSEITLKILIIPKFEVLMFGFAQLARLFCFVLLGEEVMATKHILFCASVFLEALEERFAMAHLRMKILH